MSRILLKLSGESFADPDSNFGIQPETIERIASEITEANNKGIEIGVVVGGGNFFRGVQELSLIHISEPTRLATIS